jgi:4-hydroxy-4-methyl-2-oxoglutarate aldolase
MDDEELFATMRKDLFTAVVGDVLDTMGYRHQFLPPGIGPLDPSAILVGRAMPVLEADVFSMRSDSPGPLSDAPFGLMFDALDSLQPGEIYMATGASLTYALWGGLMSTRALHLKAAVLDGCVRDAREIKALGFNVFSRGLYAQDQGLRGKVIDYRTPIEIGAVRITPGDLIFGDCEGIVVIPAIAEREAISRAIEKSNTENKVADAIRAGMGARAAWEKFGVM